MATQPNAVDAGMTFDSSPVSQDTPMQDSSGMTFDSTPVQKETPVEQLANQPVETDPRKTGEIVNDVGNKVIVPKDGENFADTMKRAVQHYQSLSPEQRQAAIDKEVKTMPGKAATTLAAAPIIGAAGTAGGAAINEVATALPSVIPHTIAGVKAIGTWANANPIQAYLLYNVLKELVPGARKAMGVIKGVPEAE
jgi:hypothetical protein